MTIRVTLLCVASTLAPMGVATGTTAITPGEASDALRSGTAPGSVRAAIDAACGQARGRDCARRLGWQVNQANLVPGGAPEAVVRYVTGGTIASSGLFVLQRSGGKGIRTILAVPGQVEDVTVVRQSLRVRFNSALCGPGGSGPVAWYAVRGARMKVVRGSTTCAARAQPGPTRCSGSVRGATRPDIGDFDVFSISRVTGIDCRAAQAINRRVMQHFDLIRNQPVVREIPRGNNIVTLQAPVDLPGSPPAMSQRTRIGSDISEVATRLGGGVVITTVSRDFETR